MIGNSPLIGSTEPSRFTSPSTKVSARQSAAIAPDALSTLAAIARSWDDPRLGMEAGERFTVTRVSGHLKPLAWHADFTRSRASESDMSGSPMMEKYGRPGETKAWTWMVNAFNPTSPTESALPIAIRTLP